MTEDELHLLIKLWRSLARAKTQGRPPGNQALQVLKEVEDHLGPELLGIPLCVALECLRKGVPR